MQEGKQSNVAIFLIDTFLIEHIQALKIYLKLTYWWELIDKNTENLVLIALKTSGLQQIMCHMEGNHHVG